MVINTIAKIYNYANLKTYTHKYVDMYHEKCRKDRVTTYINLNSYIYTNINVKTYTHLYR
jgi:hypothetical protein